MESLHWGYVAISNQPRFDGKSGDSLESLFHEAKHGVSDELEVEVLGECDDGNLHW